MSKPETLLTRRQLAATLNVHMLTITKWGQDGLPVSERGRRGKPSKYSEVEVRKWLAARETAAKASGQTDVARERARKERAQAELAEQLHRARAQELLPRQDVERAWAAEVAAVRTFLLSLPATLADRLARVATLEGVAGVERVLDESMREALLELAGGGGNAAPPAAAPRKKKGRAA